MELTDANRRDVWTNSKGVRDALRGKVISQGEVEEFNKFSIAVHGDSLQTLECDS